MEANTSGITYLHVKLKTKHIISNDSFFIYAQFQELIRKKQYYSVTIYTKMGAHQNTTFSCRHQDSFLTFLNGQSTWDSDINSVTKTLFKESNRSYPQPTDTIFTAFSTLTLKAGSLEVWRYNLLYHGLQLEPVSCCQHKPYVKLHASIQTLLKYAHGGETYRSTGFIATSL